MEDDEDIPLIMEDQRSGWRLREGLIYISKIIAII